MTTPPARRKACTRCVRGKRRCDLTKPACGRCARGGWSCHYVAVETPGPGSGSDTVDADSHSSWEDDEIDYCPFPPRDLSHSVSLPIVRVKYCAGRLKDCPAYMVKHAQTLFIKTSPTGGPLARPLSSAYSACAAYYCRTEHNTHVVKPLVMERYRKLRLTASSPSIETELANIQAILLLHILQLFDGDLELRAEAEGGLDTLRDRILHLQRRAGSEVLNSSQPPSYEAWLLAESIRRTILTYVFAEAIYLILKEGSCRTVPFMSLLPITVSGRLWAASSEIEWKKTLKLVPLQTMPYGEAVDWWKEAGSEGKLEGLQQILFAACKGSPLR